MWKRRVLKLVVFLLLGAIVNVAVAWGCVFFVNPPFSLDLAFYSGQLHEIECLPSEIEMYRGRGFQALPLSERPRLINAGWLPRGDLMVEGIGGGYIGGGSRRLTADTLSGSTVVVRIITEDELLGCLLSMRECCYQIRAGWPLTSCKGERIATGVATTTWRNDGIITVGKKLDQLHLPVLASWPGFAINTIFYAGVLWVLFAMPGVVRRRRRIKRGLCPACAYPVGASPVCTECGNPV